MEFRWQAGASTSVVERTMTVCIAAVCENGAKVVVAADRMFTAPAPVNVEFETPEKKIEGLSPACAALSSGNSAYAKEIVQLAVSTLGGKQNPAVADVAEIMKYAYLNIRMAKVKETIVLPLLGPDYMKFEQQGISLPQYLAAQAGLYQQLVIQQNSFNLGVDFILAGIDPSGGRIAYIGHPGTVAWLDKLGYGAIGSGAIHAVMRLSLSAQTSQSTLSDTLYRVFDAKRASEVAPGVGNETDIAIVDQGKIEHCSIATLESLETLFKKTRDRVSPDTSKLDLSPPP
jgi:20S proteasome alpha/beta subunit